MKTPRGAVRTLFVSFALLSAACGKDGDDTDTAGGDDKCYSVPVNTKNDGSSACGGKTCAGGTYCSSNVGICDPGCPDEFHCASGQTCDMSSPTTNSNGDPIGICRAPNANEETACGETTGSATTGPATTAGAESTTTEATPTSTTGTAANCTTRCTTKVVECDGPAEVAQGCGEICMTASEEDIACLEAKTCVELGTAWENGMTVCNVGP